MSAPYETDFSAWHEEQVQLLKEKAFDKLDLFNLVAEFEDLGERRILKDELCDYFQNRLTYDYQLKDSVYWIREFMRNAACRIRIALEDKATWRQREYLNGILQECYEKALQYARIDATILEKDVPKKCPWTLDDVLEDYYRDGDIFQSRNREWKESFEND